MAPKAKGGNAEEPPSGAELAETVKEAARPRVWTYGVNEHLAPIKEIPAGFQPAGRLRSDYLSLCSVVGAFPHTAFKPKVSRMSASDARRHSSLAAAAAARRGPGSTVGEAAGRRHSISSAQVAQLAAPGDVQKSVAGIGDEEKKEDEVQEPSIVVRSTLLDWVSMSIFALLLPSVVNLRSITFSDCRLDMEMLRLLRRGLSDTCAVEALQLEWNTFDLPLPEAEVPPEPEEGDEGSVNGEDPNDPEVREVRRHMLQCQRGLRSFRSWLSDTHGGWEQASAILRAPNDEELLTRSELQDALESRNIAGPQVPEMLDSLDGPGYGFGEGRSSLAALRQALQDLPEEPEGPDDAEDPIGCALAEFANETCVLESLSLRTCGIGLPEVKPLSAALRKCPWQLRALNLWDNRLCDTAARVIAEGLSEYRGIEYMGLGRNRITERGLELLCAPFNALILDEAGFKIESERLKQEGVQREAAAKAKAKAKAKAPPEPVNPRGRVPTPSNYDLEELPTEEGAEKQWALKKPSELQTLNLSENPIKDVKTVEAMQPLGMGSELVLRGTPAAAVMIGRPQNTRDRRMLGGKAEGWQLRLV